MVEVFKTNVPDNWHSEKLLKTLSSSLPGMRINFDLSDCDRILRVEGDPIPALRIIEMVRTAGFLCEILL